MKNCYRVVVLAVALGLAGCGGKSGSVKEDGGYDSGSGYVDSPTSGVATGSGFSGHPLDDPQSPLSNKVVYFEFDRYDVQPQYRDIITAHGAYLASNSGARVRLEGHCDERGTREYNLGLGERRANAVRELLMAAGARAGQIETVSYGEEQPVATCHMESCWSQNRRAVVVYTVR
ncbi:MAG: peptidoglycan-associated lipoprotein Pal [Pseudomonadota bacterium]|nr:peptidoglycan-associated lipoprotein Pal [Pseudomonadota bacterium]